MVTAVDLPVVVMECFAAAFDYGNLDSSFGCSYLDLNEIVLPLHEYFPLAPFDETYQDEVASYHSLRFAVELEGHSYTFHRAY